MNINLYLLNSNLEKVKKISGFSSLIWVRRYYDCGEFELTVPAATFDISIFQPDYFLTREDDETVMIIEQIQLQEDPDQGDYCIVSGRSAESIIDRRVNTLKFVVGARPSFYDVAYNMFYYNFMSGTSTERQIPLLIGSPSDYETSDPIITQPIYISSDYYGSNLMECIFELCKAYGYGFKIVRENDQLHFYFYNGVNRSRNQNDIPRVIFTFEFGNLLNSRYSIDYQTEKTAAFIIGEEMDDGTPQQTTTIGVGSGLARKEIFVDASDLSHEKEDESIMTDEEYITALQNRGLDSLAENQITETNEFDFDPYRMYKYRQDFFVGDIITCVNKYGIQTNARITEMNEILDQNGYSLKPKVEGVSTNDNQRIF